MNLSVKVQLIYEYHDESGYPRQHVEEFVLTDPSLIAAVLKANPSTEPLDIA